MGTVALIGSNTLGDSQADTCRQGTNAAGLPPRKLVLKLTQPLLVAVVASADKLGGKLIDLQASKSSVGSCHRIFLCCLKFSL